MSIDTNITRTQLPFREGNRIQNPSSFIIDSNAQPYVTQFALINEKLNTMTKRFIKIETFLSHKDTNLYQSITNLYNIIETLVENNNILREEVKSIKETQIKIDVQNVERVKRVNKFGEKNEVVYNINTNLRNQSYTDKDPETTTNHTEINTENEKHTVSPTSHTVSESITTNKDITTDNFDNDNVVHNPESTKDSQGSENRLPLQYFTTSGSLKDDDIPLSQLRKNSKSPTQNVTTVSRANNDINQLGHVHPNNKKNNIPSIEPLAQKPDVSLPSTANSQNNSFTSQTDNLDQTNYITSHKEKLHENNDNAQEEKLYDGNENKVNENHMNNSSVNREEETHINTEKNKTAPFAQENETIILQNTEDIKLTKTRSKIREDLDKSRSQVSFSDADVEYIYYTDEFRMIHCIPKSLSTTKNNLIPVSSPNSELESDTTDREEENDSENNSDGEFSKTSALEEEDISDENDGIVDMDNIRNIPTKTIELPSQPRKEENKHFSIQEASDNTILQKTGNSNNSGEVTATNKNQIENSTILKNDIEQTIRASEPRLGNIQSTRLATLSNQNSANLNGTVHLEPNLGLHSNNLLTSIFNSNSENNLLEKSVHNHNFGVTSINDDIIGRPNKDNPYATTDMDHSRNVCLVKIHKLPKDFLTSVAETFSRTSSRNPSEFYKNMPPGTFHPNNQSSTENWTEKTENSKMSKIVEIEIDKSDDEDDYSLDNIHVPNRIATNEQKEKESKEESLESKQNHINKISNTPSNQILDNFYLFNQDFMSLDDSLHKPKNMAYNVIPSNLPVKSYLSAPTKNFTLPCPPSQSYHRGLYHKNITSCLPIKPTRPGPNSLPGLSNYYTPNNMPHISNFQSVSNLSTSITSSSSIKLPGLSATKQITKPPNVKSIQDVDNITDNFNSSEHSDNSWNKSANQMSTSNPTTPASHETIVTEDRDDSLNQNKHIAYNNEVILENKSIVDLIKSDEVQQLGKHTIKTVPIPEYNPLNRTVNIHDGKHKNVNSNSDNTSKHLQPILAFTRDKTDRKSSLDSIRSRKETCVSDLNRELNHIEDDYFPTLVTSHAENFSKSSSCKNQAFKTSETSEKTPQEANDDYNILEVYETSKDLPTNQFDVYVNEDAEANSKKEDIEQHDDNEYKAENDKNSLKELVNVTNSLNGAEKLINSGSQLRNQTVENNNQENKLERTLNSTLVSGIFNISDDKLINESTINSSSDIELSAMLSHLSSPNSKIDRKISEEIYDLIMAKKKVSPIDDKVIAEMYVKNELLKSDVVKNRLKAQGEILFNDGIMWTNEIPRRTVTLKRYLKMRFYKTLIGADELIDTKEYLDLPDDIIKESKIIIVFLGNLIMTKELYKSVDLFFCDFIQKYCMLYHGYKVNSVYTMFWENQKNLIKLIIFWRDISRELRDMPNFTLLHALLEIENYRIYSKMKLATLQSQTTNLKQFLSSVASSSRVASWMYPAGVHLPDINDPDVDETNIVSLLEKLLELPTKYKHKKHSEALVSNGL